MSAGVVATLIARLLVLPGAALLTVALPAEPAEAHSVAQTDMSATLTQETAARLAAQGGINPGDRIDYVIKFAPVRNGANTGPNGWVTSYIPPGLQVIGADFVKPDGSGGWTPTTPDPPAPINDGFGGQANSSFGGPFAGFAPGSLAQYYAETGIFFSTDPRTTKFNKTTSGDATPALAPIQLTNGYRIDPTGCGQLTSIVGASECRTHNAWDAQNTHAFGSSSPSTADPQPPGNITTPYIASGRGNTPHLVGSPVAGPDTHYKLDYTGNVGPWQRIAYPGSMIGTGSAPTTAGSPTDTAWVPTSAGRSLSPSNPLPASTNAVRFAVGAIEVGTIEYVLLSTIMVDATDPNACRALDTEVFGGDAAGVDGGKDNAWRYHEPVPAVGYTCLAFEKIGPATSSGGAITYTIRTTNTSTRTLTNLAITDTLPSGSSLISATPAPTSVSGGVITWPTVASLAPGAQLSYTVRITPNSDNIIINQARLKTDQTDPIKSEAVTAQNLAALSLGKSVTPSNSAQGSEVTYTVTVRNTGGAAASTVDITDVLPSGFTYVTGSTSNGLANPSISGRSHTWRIPNVAAGATYSFIFRAKIGTLVADGTYPNELRAQWSDGLGTRTTGAMGLAPVTVTRPPTPGEVCFAVSDANDSLYTIRKDGTAVATRIGPTGVADIEAMAIDPTGRTIYAANADVRATLGIIDPATGTYNVVGTMGTARGSRGTITIVDPDGLAFDPFTGHLWASERTAGEDLLFRIDPATGRVVPDAFGPGVDYIVSDPTNVAADDIDDITIDPTDGTLYGSINSGTTNNRLVRIDKMTGVVTVVGPFRLGGTDVQDVEGMSITPDGQLLISTGDGGGSYSNSLFSVDKNTGATTLIRAFGAGGDYEALGCFTGVTAGVNTISGIVFTDTDGDGVVSAGEPRLANKRVQLFLDVNRDGIADPAVDTLIDTAYTASDGSYRWSTSVLGAYAIRVLPADVPAGSTRTTPSSGSHVASFTSFGNTDAGNDFGYRPPDALAVTKTSDVTGPVRPGQVITYTVQVENTSATVQTGVRVTDPVPAGTTYVTGSSQVTAPTAVTSTVASDSYTLGTYASGTGWTGAWREDPGDDGSPTGGDYRIESDLLGAAQRLQKDGWVERDVDLTSYASATLTFKSRLNKHDGPLDVVVNGVTLASYPGANTADTAYTTRTVDITGAVGRVSTIRFRTVDTDKDQWYVDDVVVSGVRYTGGNTTVAGGDLAAGQPLAQGYGLQPGGRLTATFRVRVNDPIALSSIDNTAGARSNQQPATSSASVSDPVGASLGDLVWLDANGDGVRDAGEPGIGGVTVTAVRVSDGATFTTTTAADGSYLFPSLAVGSYDVTPSGAPLTGRMATTGPLPKRVTLAAGDALRTADFGYRDVIDLSLTKSATPSDPDVGQAVMFDLRATNAGPGTATNVVVTDVLPAGVSFDGDFTDPGEGATVGSATYDAGTRTVRWTIPTLASGANGRLTLEVTNDTVAAKTNLAQVAAADQLDSDSTPGNLGAAPAEDDEAAATLTPRSADLEITKTVDQATPRPGGQVVFTVTVRNFGPSTSSGIVVQDTLPAGLTFVRTQNHTAGAAPTATGNVVTWNLGTLTNGASASVEVVARVDSGVAGTPLTNTATISSVTTSDPGPRPNTATAVVDPVVVDLELAKAVGDPTPQRGADVTYTLTLDNTGPDGATGVVVTDLLPAGLEFVTGSGSAGVAYDSGTRLITWTVGAVAAGGQATASYDVTVTTEAAITNRAQVAAADQVDRDSTPGNNAGEDDEAAAGVNAQDVDLELAYTTSTAAPQVGEVFTLRIELANVGTDHATGVAVTDALVPTGLTWVSTDLTGGQGSYDPTSGVWTVGQVDAGAAPLVLVLRVRADAPGTFTSDAQVTAADQFDVDSTPNNLGALPVEDDEGRVTVTTPTVDLELGKTVTANASPNPGELVEFTLTLTNRGPSAATGIVVTDQLPVGLTFDASADVTASGRTLTWSVAGPLAAGAVTAATFTARVDAPGAFRNVAEVTAVDQYDVDSRTTFAGRGVDPTTADPATFEDDEAAAEVATQGADLELTKTITGNPRPRVGQQVTFRIEVTNRGPDDADDVVVTDTAEAGLTLASASDAGFDVGTGVWTIGTIASGATVAVQVVADVTANGSFANSAEVTGVTQADPDSTPGNAATTDEDDEDTVTVETQVIDLELAQAITRNPVPNVGDEVDLTLTVTNVGTTDDATGVTILDRLPAGLAFVSAAGDGTFDPATGIWGVGTVAANGGSATITLTVRVTSDQTQTNQAQVATADQVDVDSTPGDLPAGAAPVQDDETAVSVTPKVIDLSVTQTLVSPAAPRVGDTVVYEVTVSNAAGVDDATGVVVRDLLPASLAYVSDTAGDTAANGLAYDPVTGDWTVGGVPAGETRTFRITATVVDSGVITTDAQVQAATEADRDSTPGNLGAAPAEDDEARVAYTVAPAAELSLTKTVSDATPNPGDQVTFTITVTNAGPDDATNVTVADVLDPAAFSFVSSTGTYLPGTGVWDVGTVAVGTPESIDIVAEVLTTGTASNTAEVRTSDQYDPTSIPGNGLAGEDDQDTVTLRARNADLAVTKRVAATSTATPNVGDTVTFEVDVTNGGPDPATGVVISDPVPAGTTFASASATSGSYDDATGRWTLAGALASGATATLTVTLTVDDEAPFDNVASVIAVDQNDPDPANDTSTVRVTPTQADLNLAKTVDIARPNVGDRVVFTVTLTNQGPDTATGISVRDVLPAGMSLVADSPSVGTYAVATGTWSVPTLANGASATLALDVTVDTIGAKTNRATVTGADQFDPDLSDQSATAVVTPKAVDLELTKTVSTPAPQLGDQVTFRLTVRNRGPDTATQIVVGDLLPAGLTFVSSSAPADYDPVAGRWSIASVAAGATATLDVVATVDSFGVKENVAEILSAREADVDSTPGNGVADPDDLARVSVRAQQVDLELFTTVDPGPHALNGPATFTVTVTNSGTDAATGVTVTDLIPAGIQLDGSSASKGTYAGGVWSIGTVAVGETVTLTLVTTVTATGTSTYTAQVATQDQADVDSVPGAGTTAEDDHDQVDVVVAPTADLSLTKTASTRTPNVGDSVTFTVALRNDGPDTATNVTVSDPAPAGMTFTSVDPGAGNGYAGGVWSVPTLASGATATLTVVARIDQPAPGPNVAEVTAADQVDPDSTPGNGAPGEDDRASVSVSGTAIDLSLAKTFDSTSPTTTPDVGDTVVYRLVVSNAGPSAATGVSVRDLLPTSLSFVASSGPGAYDPSTGLWTVPGSIPAGGSVARTITARVVASGTVANTAQVQSATQPDLDSTPGNSVGTEDDQATLSVTVAPAADLSLTKVASTTTPNRGRDVTFTVTLRNAGPDAATGVVVTDLLPAGLAFKSATPAATYDAGTGEWTVASLAAGASATLTVVATVTTVSPVTNVAEITTAGQHDPDSTPGNGPQTPAEDDRAAVTLTPQQVDLSLTKRLLTAGPVTYGDTITFEVLLANAAGSSTATNVVVTDLLPAGLTHVSSTPQTGTYVPATGVWSVPSLAAGATTRLTVSARVTSTGTLTNVAEVTAADQADVDSTPGNGPQSPAEDDRATADVVVPAAIDLSVTKTVDDATPDVGDTVRFTIAVTNAGPDVATDVEIADVLTPAAGRTVTASNATAGVFDAGTGVWALPTLAVGSQTLTLDVRLDAAGTFDNVARVMAANEADLDSTPGDVDPTQDDEASATVTTRAIDLAVTQTVSTTTPALGATVEYVVTVTNDAAAPDTATGVAVTDLLPAGVTYVSHTSTGGTYTPGTGLWTVGTLAPGASQTLRITARVDVTTPVTNLAEVTAADQADVDSTPGNHATQPSEDDSAVTVVDAPDTIDLSLTKTLITPTPITVTQQASFEIVVTNDGPDAATGVVVEDRLPSDLQYVSDDGGAATSELLGVVTWDVGTIAPGTSRRLTLTVVVIGATDTLNVAEVVAAAQPDVDSTPGDGLVGADDLDTASIAATEADLRLSKTVTAPAGRPEVGDTVTFAVGVTNDGPDTASGVAVADLLPAGLTLQGTPVATQGTYDASTGIWNVGTLANAASATLTIGARVDTPAPVTNAARISASDTYDPDPSDDRAEVTVDAFDADVALDVSVSSPTVAALGDPATFTVTVTNEGSEGIQDDATGVVVTDLVPAGFTVTGATASAGTTWNGLDTWTVGTLAPGVSATLVLTGMVDAPGPLTNTAQVTAATHHDRDSTPANGDPAEDDQDAASVSAPATIDLSLTNSTTATTVDLGDLVTFDLTVTNAGPSPATGVRVQDVLPAGMTFVSSPDAVTAVGQTLTWQVGSVPVGATVSTSITVRVTQTGPLTTVAQVSAADQPDVDSTPGNSAPAEDDQAPAGVTVAPAADLRLAKSVSDPAPNPGDTVTFTLAVTNDGPDAASGVTVLDLLPSGVTFQSAAGDGTYASGTGIWTVGVVPSGLTRSIDLVVRVDAGGTITNVADVRTSDQFDPDSIPGNTVDTEDDHASVSLSAGLADIEVTKGLAAGSSATPAYGDTVTFSVTARNLGPDTATTIRVQDTLPAGLTYVASGGLGAYDPVTGVWRVPDLAPGASAELLLTARVVATGTITNTASLTSLDQDDQNAANDGDDQVLTVPAAIDLSVTQRIDNASPDIGDEVVITVSVTNDGPDAATGVVVTDALPAGLTFVSADSPDYVGSTWTVGDLAVGETKTLDIRVRVETGEPVTNVAQVAAADQADLDSTPANFDPAAPNEDDESELVIDARSIDLSLDKSVVGTSTPSLGDQVTFRLTLTNAGPDAATGVVVRDVLPAGLTYVSDTGTYTAATATWPVGSVAAGGSATLDIVATVTATGRITNLAQVVAADQPDADSTPASLPDDATTAPEDDEDTAILDVPATADLSLTKTVSTSSPNVGDVVTFTVAVSNAGPDDATGVRVRDLLPAGLTFVTARPSGVYDAATGTWIVGSVAKGTTRTLEIDARVTTTAPVTNTAQVSRSDQRDGDSTPNNSVVGEDDQASVTLSAQVADLRLTKTVDDAAPPVGSDVTFTVRVTNDGPAPATNVTVKDVLPAGLTFVSASGGYDETTGIWTVGDVPVGPAGVRTLTVTASVTATDAVANVAEVWTSDQADPDSVPGNGAVGEDDRAQAGLNAVSADLAVDKQVDRATAAVGEQVTYTIEVTNQSGETATNVVLRDDLPAGLRAASHTATQGGYDPTTGLWTVGDVPVGTTHTLTLVSDVVAGGVQTNVVQVAASDQVDTDSTPNNSDPTEDDQDGTDVTVAFPASIGDTVFEDLDGDGVQDPGEPGVPGVRVVLTRPDLTTVERTTDATGRYLFDLLTPGSYTVDVDGSSAPVAGLVLTTANDPTTLSLAEGDAVRNVDFGFRRIADLSLTHAVDDATPAVGQTVQLTVTVTNDGPSDATGVRVTEPLPAGLTFISATPSQGSYAAGTWTVGDLATGASADLVVLARVTTSGTRDVVAQVSAADQFDIDSTPGNGVEAEDDQQTVALVTPVSIDLELTEDVDVARPAAGQPVTFTVTLTNRGPDTATGVAVTSPIPSGVTLQSSAPSQGTYDPSTGVWSVGTLAPGATVTLDLVVLPSGPATVVSSSQVSAANEPDVDSTPANGIAGEDDQDSATINPLTTDVSVTKTVDNATPTVGQQVTFTIVTRNAGPDPADSVALLDQLASGFGYVSHTTTRGTYDPTNGVWELGTLAAGASATLTLTVVVRTDSPTTNLAEVESNDAFDTDPTNDRATATVDATLVDVELTKTVDDATPSFGQSVVYTLTARNQGPDGATGVVVRDQLPNGMQLVSADDTAYDGATGLWSIGSLARNEVRVLRITATATGAGTFANVAEVTATDQTDRDSRPGNGILSEDDQDRAVVTMPAASSIGDTVFLDLDGDGIQDAGEPGISGVTVGLRFAGPDDTFDTGDDVVLPATVTDPNGRYVFDGLTDGSYRVQVDEATLPAGYVLTSGTNPRVVSLPPGTTETTVDFSYRPQVDIAVTNAVDDATPNPGQVVTFTVTATNLGPAPATGVQITDLLPAGLTFISATGPYVQTNGIWTVGDLAVGETKTLRIDARVDGAGPFTSTARRTGTTQADVQPANDVASVSLAVATTDLAVAATVDQARPALGGTVTFTVDVTNQSTADATGVRLSAPLPAGMTITGSTGVGTYDGTTWVVGDLPAGTTQRLTITATVDALGTHALVAQVAALDQRDVDSTPGNGVEAEDDQQTVSVTPVAIDLELAMTAAPVAPTVGQNVTYRLTLDNVGPDGATGVRVSLPLPAGVSFVSANGAYNPSTGIWTVGSLGAGGQATLDLVVAVRTGGPITAVAQVSAADQRDVDSTPANSNVAEDDQAQVTTNAALADLAVRQTVSSATSFVGEQVTFVVTLEHQGGDPAGSVTVSDLVPAGLRVDSAVPSTGSYDAALGVWTVGTVTAGQTETLTITATVLSPGTLTNTAQVRTSDAFDPDSTPGNSVASEDDQASVSVTSPAPASIGDRVFEDRDGNGVQDAGEPGIGGVPVVLTLPDSSTRTVITASDGSYRFDLLRPGDHRVDVDGAAAPVAGLTLTTGNDPFDVTLAAGDVVDTVDFGFRAVVDVELTQTLLTASPAVGGVVELELVVTNTGPAGATGVVVQQTLPAGMTVVSTTLSQGTASAGAWNVGDLAAGATATALVRVQVARSGDFVIPAEVVATTQHDADSTPGNGLESEDDQQTVSFRIEPMADLRLTKDIDDPNPTIGNPSTFTVTVVNDGPDGATGVVVEDAFPAGLTLIGTRASQGTYAGGTWTVGDIPVGQRVTLELDVEPDGTVIDGSPIVNSAQVAASDQLDPDSIPANDIPGEDDQDSAAVDPTTSDLAVTKTVSDPTPTVGAQVTFTVTVTNDGPDPADSVALLDALATGFDFVAARPTSGTYTDTNGVWQLGTLAPGDTEILELDVIVRTDSPLTNLAQVESNDSDDPNPANDQARQDVDATQADLELTQTVDDTTPAYGQVVTFELVLVNQGPDATTGVTVVDQLPAGLRFISTDGTYDPATGIWNVGDLPVGATRRLVIRAEVVGAGDLTNTARVQTSDQHDPDSTPGNSVGSEDDQASVTVTGGSPGSIGDLVFRDLDGDGVRDVGEPGIAGVTVTLVSAGPNGILGDADDVTTTAVTDATGAFRFDGLAAGRYRVSGPATLAGGETLTTPATVTIDLAAGASRLDVDLGYRVPPGPVTPPSGGGGGGGATVDLELVKLVDDATVAVGDRVTFTLGVVNRGSTGATGVVVTDRLPSGLSLVSTSGDGSYAAATGRWTVGDVPAGATRTIALVVRAGQAGSVVNTAEVTAADQPDVDSTPANGIASEDDQASAAVAVAPAPAFSVTPAPGAKVEVTDRATFPHTITNDGPTPITVNVGAVNDRGFPVVVYDDVNGDGIRQPGEPVLTGPITLAPGASRHIVVEVQVPDGTAVGTVSVTTVTVSDVADPARRRVVEDELTVLGPVVGIQKTVSPDGTAVVGDELTFTMVVRNGGTAPARSVTFTDPTPPGTTYVPGSTRVDGQPVADVASGDGNPLTDAFPLGTLDVDETVTITYAVVADGPGGNVVDNVAFVEADRITRVASSVATVTVVRDGPAIRVEKSADRSTTSVGGEVTWTVRVANVGAQSIDVVRVLDEAPAGTSYIAGSTSVDGRPVADRDGTTPMASGLLVGPLAPGAATLVTFRTRVTDGTPGGTVANAAAADGGDSCNVPLGNRRALDCLEGPAVPSNQVLVAVETGTLPRTGLGLDLGRYGPIAAAMVIAGWLLLYVARPAAPVAVVGRRDEDEDDDPERDPFGWRW